ncbi:MAG: hypothetical protein H7833_21035, partial [Magnetococcus sp. DMHC-1]
QAFLEKVVNSYDMRTILSFCNCLHGSEGGEGFIFPTVIRQDSVLDLPGSQLPGLRFVAGC